jgi:hypothetical protein
MHLRQLFFFLVMFDHSECKSSSLLTCTVLNIEGVTLESGRDGSDDLDMIHVTREQSGQIRHLHRRLFHVHALKKTNVFNRFNMIQYPFYKWIPGSGG